MRHPVVLSFVTAVVQLWFLAGFVPATDESQVDRLLSSLESDSSTTRNNAVDSLRLIAISLPPNQRMQLQRQILSRALVESLEVQVLCERLANQIEVEGQRMELNRWRTQRRTHIDSDQASQALSSPLLKQYQTFCQFAEDDLDAVETFVTAASDSDFHFRVIERLTLFAPTRSRLYDSRLSQFQNELVGLSGLATGTTSDRRVLGRLIDSAVLDDRFGWNWETRLRIAMVHGRTDAALQLCSLVLEDRNAAPLPVAIAMLCESRLGGDKLEHHLNIHRHDMRMIAVTPPGWSYRRDGSRLVPPSRVQDVVLMICLEQNDIDPRSLGMKGLVADPAWGTRVESIWFADPNLRDQAAQFIFASNASLESDVRDGREGQSDALDSSMDGT